MKILYLITKSELGGAQTHVADLCRYFKKKEFEISVMSMGGGWLQEESKEIGVNFVVNNFFSNSANPFSIYKATREIKKYVSEFCPDIIHCHSSAAAFLARIAIRGNIKTIYTAHGWGFNLGINPLIRYAVLIAEKITARYTDIYICVSEFIKKLGLKYHLAPENKLRVIYNGVNFNAEENSILTNDQRSNDIQNNEIRLAFVGRLAEPKRPELVIEAINLLPLEVKTNLKFSIIGDGPKRNALEKLANDRKVKVEFKGALPRNKVVAELRLSNIFVFISAWEGFGLSILEAMSVSLPVIASNIGGIREVVNATNGILVKNEIGQIREAILKLVRDKDLRLKLGAQGRKIAEQNFSLEKMCKATEEVYYDISK
ncbi:MAG: glycosyltransferase family 4 protein [Candidatus Magasanikbacteria bacterium]|nr:glycosyltransferase family 4 protein [Candidatus Magasanikbacteria bacterium]